MDPNTLSVIQGAAGAGGDDPVYVEEVFNTTAFIANGSTGQSFVTGLDLAGEGGMVWHKDREYTFGHSIWDTERGTSSVLPSNNDSSAYTYSNSITYNSDGHSVTGAQGNEYTDKTVAWSFRKAPGFFDVVTWTGNSTAGREIPHNLGSVPGMIFVKCVSNTSHWAVYHKDLTSAEYLLRLNDNYDEWADSAMWDSTAPTSTVFTVGDDSDVNYTDYTYVAYIFAHDDQSFGDGGDESIIKCGTYTGNSSADFEVDLGWEPQYIMFKSIDGDYNWAVFDSMRGIMSDGDDNYLYPGLNNAEYTAERISLTPNGFIVDASAGVLINNNGDDYIYMAIRRGPMKTPTDATEVFDVVAYDGTGGAHDVPISPSYADLVFYKRREASDNWGWTSRLTGNLAYMTSNDDAMEANRAADDALEYDKQFAFGLVGNSSGEVNYSGESYISHAFKRAPGFFDMVCYVGSYPASPYTREQSHNLGVVPELIIVKKRAGTQDSSWTVYHSSTGNTGHIELDNDSAFYADNGDWYDTTPTSSVFTLRYNNGVNAIGKTFIAHLFATCPGVSKVGGYTGTGDDIDVDCGFTAGARFVMIKRTDATGDWYVWDTERGIVSGDDPYLFINDNAVEVTNTDYIDPFTTGFTVTSSAPDALNVSSGEYIYLAIA